jgi:pimeloyl-ACP methyl ester carboxylesterase
MKRTALVAVLLVCASVASAAPADLASAESRYAKLDAHRVHYKSIGSGAEAVVLVHGWASDMNFWREQARAFASRGRIIAIDLPGHGGSDKPEIAYTQELFARAIDAVLRDAGVERAVIVGHSMGAVAARQFCRVAPKKVKGIVAVDGALWMPVENAPAVIAMAMPLKTPEYRQTAERFVVGFMAGKLPEADQEAIRATVGATPQHVMIGAMESMGDPAVWKEDPIEAPVLIINAKNGLWPADYEAKVRAFAPDLEYHALPDVGHFLMLERPDLVNPLLEAFLVKRGVICE